MHVSLFNPCCLAQPYRRVGLEPIPVRCHGAVQLKVLKRLRHHPLRLGACAQTSNKACIHRNAPSLPLPPPDAAAGVSGFMAPCLYAVRFL